MDARIDTVNSLPAETVVGMFRRQVVRAPESIAVVAADGTLSYGELDVRASAVAGGLRDRGVGPDDIVAVAIPRGTDMVVAVLAVLAAGAAYLPVDSAQPPDRVAAVLADARPALVLTPGELRALEARRCPPPRWRIPVRRAPPMSSTPPARPEGPRAWSFPTRGSLISSRRNGNASVPDRVPGCCSTRRSASTWPSPTCAWRCSPGRRSFSRRPKAFRPASRSPGSSPSTASPTCACRRARSPPSRTWRCLRSPA